MNYRYIAFTFLSSFFLNGCSNAVKSSVVNSSSNAVRVSVLNGDSSQKTVKNSTINTRNLKVYVMDNINPLKEHIVQEVDVSFRIPELTKENRVNTEKALSSESRKVNPVKKMALIKQYPIDEHSEKETLINSPPVNKHNVEDMKGKRMSVPVKTMATVKSKVLDIKKIPSSSIIEPKSDLIDYQAVFKKFEMLEASKSNKKALLTKSKNKIELNKNDKWEWDSEGHLVRVLK